MQYLVAGIILVAVVAALNATLTLTLARRWRDRLNAPPAADADPALPGADPELGIAAGDPMPAFSAVTADGRGVTHADLAGREALVGFLSLDCSGCDDSLPAFSERAGEVRAAGGSVLAMVVGIDAGASDLVARLAEMADFVVPEFLDAPVSNLFGARYYPGFAHYGADGVVTVSGIGPAGLAAAPSGARTTQPAAP